MNGTNYQVPHCGAFSAANLHPSWAQIFASGSCFELCKASILRKSSCSFHVDNKVYILFLFLPKYYSLLLICIPLGSKYSPQDPVFNYVKHLFYVSHHTAFMEMNRFTFSTCFCRNIKISLNEYSHRQLYLTGEITPYI